MAKPQFGGWFIHVHTAQCSVEQVQENFFLWRGYHVTIKELLPHTSVDRTHYLLALFKCLPPAFRCLNSQPNFAYPYSPGFP